MKELEEYKIKNNVEKKRSIFSNNYKNTIQFGYFNDIIEIAYFNYLNETNLFNIDSYTKISVGLTVGGLLTNIGQLIKLPSIFNNSINNELEVSIGTTLLNIFTIGDQPPILLKTNIYNYYKVSNTITFVLKTNVNYFKFFFTNTDNNPIRYQISPGVKINLFNRIEAIGLLTLGGELRGIPQVNISLNL